MWWYSKYTNLLNSFLKSNTYIRNVLIFKIKVNSTYANYIFYHKHLRFKDVIQGKLLCTQSSRDDFFTIENNNETLITNVKKNVFYCSH